MVHEEGGDWYGLWQCCPDVLKVPNNKLFPPPEINPILQPRKSRKYAAAPKVVQQYCPEMKQIPKVWWLFDDYPESMMTTQYRTEVPQGWTRVHQNWLC